MIKHDHRRYRDEEEQEAYIERGLALDLPGSKIEAAGKPSVGKRIQASWKKLLSFLRG